MIELGYIQKTHAIQNSSYAKIHYALQPRSRCRSILEHLLGVSLGPLLHQLSDDLAAGQLRHLIDECDAADKPFVLGHARGGPVLDVFGRHFAF